jgi:hypothetical protein
MKWKNRNWAFLKAKQPNDFATWRRLVGFGDIGGECRVPDGWGSSRILACLGLLDPIGQWLLLTAKRPRCGV